MSQRQTIIDHLNRTGHITQIEALQQYGIMRLAPIIEKIRDDYDIWTEHVPMSGTGRRFGRYHTSEPVNCGNSYSSWKH